MESKSYVIRVSSQKGGVGKTTIATNLAVALAMDSSSRVLLVDADTTSPSVGFQLGLDDVNIGYEDVIHNRVDLKKAIVMHTPSSVSVLPGTIHISSHQPTAENIASFMKKMSGSGYDYVIIDTAPGISLLGPPEYIDEALIITTPDMTSCTSSMKLAKTLDKHKITHALLVNRAKNKRFEICKREIDELYGKISYGPVPEDEDVQESIAQHIPTLIKYGRSPFSKSIQAISYMYLAKKGRAVSEQSEGLTTGGGLIGFLKRVIGLR